jgi:chromosome segregation ATPase
VNDETHKLLEAILITLQDNGKDIRNLKAEMRETAQRVSSIEKAIHELNERVKSLNAELEQYGDAATVISNAMVKLNERIHRAQLVALHLIEKKIEDAIDCKVQDKVQDLRETVLKPESRN